MEEKAKSKVLIYIIVVISLAVLMIAVLGIMGYQKIMERMDELSGSTTNQGTVATQKQQTQTQQTVTQPAYATDPDATKVTLANETHYVKVVENIIGAKEGTDEELFISLYYEITVDGKVVNGVKGASAWGTKDMKLKQKTYEILTLKDMNEEDEYILLKINSAALAGDPLEHLYIIDKNANVIGNIDDYNIGGGTYWEKNPNDEEDTSKKIEGEIYSNYIIYIKPENGMQKHKYYIRYGNPVDETIKVYSPDEFVGAGKKV